MNKLKTELQKEIYATLTDIEVLEALPKEVTKIGRIQEEDKLDLLTLVITGNLVQRYEEAKNMTDEEILLPPEICIQYREVARVLQEAFTPNYILSDVYRINLGLDDIRAVFDAGLAFSLITQSEYDKLTDLATYTIDDFSGYTLDDVSKARSLSSPTENVETTYVSQDFLVKGRREVLHQIDVTVETLAWADTITVYAQSQNNGDSEFVQFSQPVGTLQVPANYEGTLQLTVNKSALKNKCKYFLSSKYNRTLSGYAYNNG